MHQQNKDEDEDNQPYYNGNEDDFNDEDEEEHKKRLEDEFGDSQSSSEEEDTEASSKDFSKTMYQEQTKTLAKDIKRLKDRKLELEQKIMKKQKDGELLVGAELLHNCFQFFIAKSQYVRVIISKYRLYRMMSCPRKTCKKYKTLQSKRYHQIKQHRSLMYFSRCSTQQKNSRPCKRR